MNIVIYARFSSHSQTEQSIEGQLQVCYEYAKRQGYNVIGEYIDRAISGTTDNRPDFLRMIDDSAKKQFEGVLVYQLDRFARNRYDSAIYKAKLKKNGVRVLSARENISDDASGILVEGLLESIAEYYSAELSQKIRRGMDINAEKCLSTGGHLALGFKVDDTKHIIIDEETAPAVVKVFEMYAKGARIIDICDMLNAQGYKSSRGSAFNKNSLRKMLQNRRYLGIYTYKDMEIPDGVPRIISDDLFEEVQERLKVNRQNSGHYKAKTEYILTTKLFCGHCREMMTGIKGKSNAAKPYHYYKCNGAKRKECDKKPVRKERIEDIVVNECRKLLTSDNIDRIARETVALCEREKDSPVLKRLNNLLAENERKRNNLRDILIEAPNDSVRNLMYEKIPVLEQEKQDLEQQIAKEQLGHINITEQEVKFFLTSLQQGDINDLKYRKMLVNIFLDAVYLYDDRLIYYFNIGDKPVEVNAKLIEKVESTFLGNNAPPKTKRPIRVFLFLHSDGESNASGSEWGAGGAPEPRPGPPAGGRLPSAPSPKDDNSRRIAVLFCLQYHDRAVFFLLCVR